MSKVTKALNLSHGSEWLDRALTGSAAGISDTALVISNGAAEGGDGRRVEEGQRPAGVPEFGPWDFEAVRVAAPPLSSLAALFLPKDAPTVAGEEYRMVRTRIAQRYSRPFWLVVSSPGVGDGKTWTARNLAVAFALKGEGRTLLVDADMRHPSLHRSLESDQAPGLAEVLEGAASLQEAMIRIGSLPALYFLPAGAPQENPSELLDSSRWRTLSRGLRTHFEHVIVDSPPVGSLADFDLIAEVCDGILLVVRPDHSNRTHCLAAIAKVRSKLSGVVVNDAREWFLWKKRSNRYYEYYRRSGERQGSSSQDEGA